MRRRAALLALLLLLPGAAPDPRTAYVEARDEAARAAQRAGILEARAARATNRAERARAAAGLAVARIGVAESRISAAQAELDLLATRRRAGRARIATRERPSAALLAALQALSRRPAIALLAQPGSIDDAVHVRALLASTQPVVARRTAALRRDLDGLRRIEIAQGGATARLRTARASLVAERDRLLALERVAAAEGLRTTRLALGESDRALSLGEDAFGYRAAAASVRVNRATARRLAALPGPPARPGPDEPPRTPRRPAYLLPIEGPLVTGTGEISPAGVHARGLTLRARAGAPVIAPADARVLFAGPFRAWGGVLILDHGAGWSTTLTGLDRIAVRVDQTVRRGDPVARAGWGGVNVELRRGLVPVPIPPLLRSSDGLGARATDPM